jgi:peptidoglycan LD-endopeptidase CwlK
MSSRKLEDLEPNFRELVVGWLADCAAVKLEVLITCTLRTNWEQTELYKVGRTVKGKDVTPSRPMGRKLTNAKAGQSAHNYGLAIDFVPVFMGKLLWEDTKKFDKAIKLAEARGMESLRPFELAHLQLKGFNWRDYKK